MQSRLTACRDQRHRSSPQQSVVAEPALAFPRAILVCEIDSVAQRGMTTAKQHEQPAGPRDCEILLLQADESRCGGMVVSRQLEPEPVGLVLLVPAEGEYPGADHEGHRPPKKQKQGKGGHVR